MTVLEAVKSNKNLRLRCRIIWHVMMKGYDNGTLEKIIEKFMTDEFRSYLKIASSMRID